MDHDDAVLLEFQRRYVAGAGEEGGVKKGARRGETRHKELNVKTAEEERREEELEEEEKRKKVEKARAVLAPFLQASVMHLAGMEEALGAIATRRIGIVNAGSVRSDYGPEMQREKERRRFTMHNLAAALLRKRAAAHMDELATKLQTAHDSLTRRVQRNRQYHGCVYIYMSENDIV